MPSTAPLLRCPVGILFPISWACLSLSPNLGALTSQQRSCSGELTITFNGLANTDSCTALVGHEQTQGSHSVLGSACRFASSVRINSQPAAASLYNAADHPAPKSNQQHGRSHPSVPPLQRTLGQLLSPSASPGSIFMPSFASTSAPLRS